MIAALYGIDRLAIPLKTRRHQMPLDTLFADHSVAAQREFCFDSNPSPMSGSTGGHIKIEKPSIKIDAYLDADVAASVRAKINTAVAIEWETTVRISQGTWHEIELSDAIKAIKPHQHPRCYGSGKVTAKAVYRFAGAIADKYFLMIDGQLEGDATLPLVKALKKIQEAFPKIKIPNFGVSGRIAGRYEITDSLEQTLVDSTSSAFQPLRISGHDIFIKLQKYAPKIDILERISRIHVGTGGNPGHVKVRRADCDSYRELSMQTDLVVFYNSLYSGDDKDLVYFAVSDEQHRKYALIVNTLQILDQSCADEATKPRDRS